MATTEPKIEVTWNAHTCMYQAKVRYNGQESKFALPDAANDWEARNQAKKVMSDYIRQTKR